LTGAKPLQRIAVGVVVERCPATSAWIDHVWRPVAVLAGEPDTAPWTRLTQEEGRETFYAGAAEIHLYRSETANYRDNLASGEALLWVVLRPTGAEPPFTVVTVTADPAEGEAFTEPATDLVEAVPMPPPIVEAVSAFTATHHVERVFEKRQRDRADPDAMGRRGRRQGDQ